MNDYIEICRYPSFEMIKQIKIILDEKNIDYKIEDTTPSFDVTFANNTSNIQYILKIENKDFKKAEAILNNGAIESFEENDHYLNTFTDDELIDVVLNPKEWYNGDVEYAKKLIKDRNIDLSENDIEEYKKNNQVLDELIEYAKSEIITKNKKPNDIKEILLSKGLEKDIAEQIIFEINNLKTDNSKKTNNDLIFGLLWLSIGIGLTFANIGYIFWGAIAYGGYRLFKGLK